MTASIDSIHQKLLHKNGAAEEITQDYFKKIKLSNHNAFLSLSEERALHAARAADLEIKKNGESSLKKFPLLGVPIAIKDALQIRGEPTTCASRILEGYVSPFTATCVERLENAGAVLLGKLNMDEFAMGGSNENSAFGPVIHPTHPEHVPGGSSGGSAVAVKADLCVASLGSDTGGSIRLPSSFCGTVGLKPTYGRVSRFGLVAFASSLDQVGPIANRVEDVARVFEVIAGLDPRDSTTAGISVEPWSKTTLEPLDFSKLKIGRLKAGPWEESLQPEVKKALVSATEWACEQGATVIDVELPHMQHAVSVYYLVAVSEASSNLARFDGVRFGSRPKSITPSTSLEHFYEQVRAQFGPEVKRRILLGTFALSSGYADEYFLKAAKVRRLIAEDFKRALSKVDLILGPVCASTAFRMGEKAKNPLSMYLTDLFTIPANLAGLPAMSLPWAKDENGLPIGLHLTAGPFQETLMLKVAHAFEGQVLSSGGAG